MVGFFFWNMFFVSKRKENFWTIILFLFFSLAPDLQRPQTNKILNYIFKQSIIKKQKVSVDWGRKRRNSRWKDGKIGNSFWIGCNYKHCHFLIKIITILMFPSNLTFNINSFQNLFYLSYWIWKIMNAI